MDLNVFGEPIITCSTQPLTGFFRDGCCKSDEQDMGTHTVCAIVTKDFLAFSKLRGNDLSTPRPEYQFTGLQPGDKWCLCTTRWVEAYRSGCAPLVILEATNEKTLDFVSIDTLVKFAYKGTI